MKILLLNTLLLIQRNGGGRHPPRPGGGHGGGCHCGSCITTVPTVPEWFMILFFITAIAIAIYYIRKYGNEQKA